MPKQVAEMVVELATFELPDTKTLRLRWPDGYQPEFKTGQFITLYFPDAPAYKRAYSLSSCALDRGYFEVTIKRDGKMGTRIVDWVQAGDKLWVIPPTGRFLPVLEPEKHLICIAGGSGVTPFRAFAREATRRQLRPKSPFFTACAPRKTSSSAMNSAPWRGKPRLKFEVTCTRVPPEDPWPGRRGRIEAGWIRAHIGELNNTVFYACGPNALVEATEHLVTEEMRVPREQMKVEKWG